jgi:hypothetical protein
MSSYRPYSPFFFCWAFLIQPAQMFANAHFTIKGTVSDSNYGLVTQSNHAASASIEFDLGRYFRIGVTHRQAKGLSKGYYAGRTVYEYKTSKTHETANSLDLSIILYYGEVFVPFVQVGLVKKNYVVTYDESPQPITNKISIPPIPNGGFGLGIRLHENFSLKLSQTLSPGIRIPYPNAPAERAVDTYSSVGITYDL